MPTGEIIHTENVALFEKLVSAVASYGSKYNPGRETLELSGLEILLHDARLAMKEVASDSAALTDAANKREIAFDGLDKLAAQIGYALEIGNVYQIIGEAAQNIIYKLQGTRAAPKIADNPDTPEIESAKPTSLSQMSFDNRIAYFEKLIQLLESQDAYAPEETDLNPAPLRKRLNDMKAKNTAAINAATALSGSRMVRSEVFYDDESGLVTIAHLVKEYAKSAFGAESPEYQQIKDLKFTKPG